MQEVHNQFSLEEQLFQHMKYMEVLFLPSSLKTRTHSDS